MHENEAFTGAFIRLPIGFYERLAAAAETHHQRLSQWVDMTTADGTMFAISSWLDHLEQARTRPTPAAEPGDLLVKLARSEFWTFTVHGWRELAPIELVERDVPEDAGLLGEHGAAHNVHTDDAMREIREDIAARKLPRFWGRSVVEDELDRLAAADRAKEFDFASAHQEVHAAIDEHYRQQADAELEGGVVLALADWLSHRNDLKGKDVA